MSNLKSFLHVGALIKYQTKITKPTEMKIEKKSEFLFCGTVSYMKVKHVVYVIWF